MKDCSTKGGRGVRKSVVKLSSRSASGGGGAELCRNLGESDFAGGWGLGWHVTRGVCAMSRVD